MTVRKFTQYEIKLIQRYLNAKYAGQLTVDGDAGNLPDSNTIREAFEALLMQSKAWQATQPKPPVAPPKPPTKPAPQPTKRGKVFTPKEWKSRGSRSGYNGVVVNLTNDYMIPHYGAIAGDGPTTAAAEMAMVRSFENYHLDGQGWDGGLAYHYAVGKSGNAYMSARGQHSWRGAHTGNAKKRSGDPNTNLGIVLLLGNHEKPTPAMMEMVNHLRDKYNIKGIRYHKEFDWTSCPGTVIPKYVK